MFSTVTAKTPSLSSRAMASGVLAVFLVFTSGLFMTSQAIKAPDLTPPMGWNSYDCYGYGVTEAQFMADVHYMANNYKQYGWQYCIVDYVWWIPDLGASANINQQSNWNLGNMDQYGRFLPDTTRFPSAKGGKGFQALADSVHNLGLKFGIHVMRGVPRMADTGIAPYVRLHLLLLCPAQPSTPTQHQCQQPATVSTHDADEAHTPPSSKSSIHINRFRSKNHHAQSSTIRRRFHRRHPVHHLHHGLPIGHVSVHVQHLSTFIESTITQSKRNIHRII